MNNNLNKKKIIVIYYSRKGSNKFLANKISDKLKCDIEELKPRLNIFLLLLFGLSFGNKRIKSKISEYKMVVLCGPIWMGKFITPLKTFLKKYKKDITKLVFTTCCGSSYEMKEKKFGHGLVFNIIKDMSDEKCIHFAAFPITLVVPKDKREDPNIVMKTILTNDNFKDEILNKFNDFIQFINKYIS